MQPTGSCLALAVLFLASVLPSNAQSEAAAEATTPQAAPLDTGLRVSEADMQVHYYDVRQPLMLDCAGLVSDPAVELVWKKNNTVLEKVPELKDRYELSKGGSVFTVKGRSQEDDAGNYTCSAATGAVRAWSVRGHVHAKLPANTNVVEGQKLTITCKLIGKPYPPVEWLYSNVSETVARNESLDVREAFGDRVKLRPSEQNVPDARLVIEPAQRSDAGWYRCQPIKDAAEEAVDKADAAKKASQTPPTDRGSVTTVRVKDMYAALWPFLGICAEVFVLCAIILVYEKRRTKPELDDSDTDNHDQKKS